jgi:hypothetical protein
MSASEISERAAQGRAARKSAPRSAHAEWEPAAGRRPAIETVLDEEAGRVPELLPLRHSRMLASPFTFFRGAAAVMAGDLAGTPCTGVRVQLCGDAHLSNFGGFASPDRRMVFDINDFDETAPGPWEWDVKRLAASVAIAGRDIGLGERRRHKAVEATVRAYREAIRDFAAMGNLEVWYARLDAEAIVAEMARRSGSKRAKAVQKGVERAQGKDSLRALSKLCERSNGDLRFASRPPLLVPVEELMAGTAGEDVVQDMRSCSGATAAACAATAGGCSTATATCTWPARSSASAASAPAPGCCCCGARRPGPALPPGEGGRPVGARVLRGREPHAQPRAARGAGPVADAGGERHLPRLVARAGPKARIATSMCGSCGTGRRRPTWRACPPRT